MLVPYHHGRQRGGAMPAFQGAAIQRGRGLGGVLGGSLRNIIFAYREDGWQESAANWSTESRWSFE